MKRTLNDKSRADRRCLYRNSILCSDYAFYADDIHVIKAIKESSKVGTFIRFREIFNRYTCKSQIFPEIPKKNFPTKYSFIHSFFDLISFESVCPHFSIELVAQICGF